MKKNQVQIKSDNKTTDGSHHPFVGPKALFDPYYVPAILFDRKKEEKFVSGLVEDAVTDNFPAVLSVYGIKGAGKTVLVNKSLEQILGEKINESGQRVIFLRVECEGKGIEQILFSIINRIAKFANININPDSIINAETRALWNLFKLSVSKLNGQVVLFLDSVEYTDPKVLNRIIDFCKSESMILISCFNVPKSSPFLLDFKRPDFKIEIGSHNLSSLYKIGEHRWKIGIDQHIDSDMVHFIVDLIGQFDKHVPGSIVRVLREVYPLIKNGVENTHDEVRDRCRYHFEGYNIDELSVAEYISESTLTERLFLDNICGYFLNTDEFYMPYDEIKNNYMVACENLELPTSQNAFSTTLNQLRRISLLLPSHFDMHMITKDSVTMSGHRSDHQKIPVKETNRVPHFITVPPESLHEMLNVAFGSY